MSNLSRRTVLSVAVLGWALTACAARLPADPVAINASTRDSVKVIRQNAASVTGGLWLVPLAASALSEPPPIYQGRPVWIGLLGGQAMAVIGLGLADAGQQVLLAADGQAIATTQVIERAYAEQHLTLTQTEYVSPAPEQLARFEREALLQKAAYRAYTTPADAVQPASWPAFQWPLQGRVSSLFGLRRFFNGEPRAPHLGLDIAGPSGAPVRAPASGRVTLTGDFFFNGRTVIIDHGRGLFSMLCHFSQIEVKAGDEVSPDTVVGLVGATGRATAPHLHWTVSLNDARIDPRRLLVEVPATDR